MDGSGGFHRRVSFVRVCRLMSVFLKDGCRVKNPLSIGGCFVASE